MRPFLTESLVDRERSRSNTCSCFFFFNDTATTEIYTLSLHDALPIYQAGWKRHRRRGGRRVRAHGGAPRGGRSEEQTSELQSRPHLVRRLLPEQKKDDKQRLPLVDNLRPIPDAALSDLARHIYRLRLI